MIRQERENQFRRAQHDREKILQKIEPDLKLVRHEEIKPLIGELTAKEDIEDLEASINRYF